MRLHTLTLTAIGPFAGTEVVDFDRLGAGGLFLLEGPTGAGKTTVLDAVTFGLFGTLSGPGASLERLHSDFAARAVTPRVVLEVTLRGHRYRLTRSPEHLRPKMRGEGDTTESATALLQRLDGDEVTTLGHSVADVNVQVKGLVGLDVDQFRQVVLLPQGEFARFLRSSGDERETVLARLFDVVRYRQVTSWLEQRAAAARRERDEAEQAIGRAAAAAAEAAGLDAEAPLVAARGEVLTAALADERARLAGASAAAAAGAVAAGTVRSAAEAAEAQAAAAVARYERWQVALDEAAALEASADEHAARRAQLARARVVAPLLPTLAAADEARIVLDAARGVVAGLDPAGTLAPEGAAVLRSRALILRTDAARLDSAAALEEAAPHRAAAGSAAAAAAAAADAALVQARDEAAALPARIESLRADREACTAAAGLLAPHEQAEASARAVLAAVERRELLAAGLVAARAAVDGAQAAGRAAAAAAQRARAGRIAGIAAELALHLRPGEPCEVCGSTQHPRPASPSPDHVSPEQVKAAEATAAGAVVALAGATEELGRLEAEIAGVSAIAGPATPAAAAAALANAEQQLATTRASAGRSHIAAEQLRAAEATLASAEERIAELGAALATSQEQARALGREAAGIDAMLADARAAYPSVADRRASLGAEAEQLDALAAAVEEAARFEHEHRGAVDRLAQLLLSAGLPDADAVRADALDAAELSALARQVDDDEQRRTAVRGRLEAEEFASLTPQGEAAARTCLQDGAAARAGAVVAETAALEERARAEERNARFAAASAHVAATRAEADAVVAGTAALLRLDALVRGISGDPRMSLVVFVLRYWFDHVVDAANLRLSTMSAGRYQLERTDDTEHRARRAGLGLQVIDTHTGQARPTSSLSGGETFFASLALALGLADVVRAQAGGGDLDTLFIDEGFGTLDADTLEQVMDVVDALRVGGRVVGIVSHVDDLKARIPERLEVRRHDDGSSWLHVRA